jgi:hypothetical protein
VGGPIRHARTVGALAGDSERWWLAAMWGGWGGRSRCSAQAGEEGVWSSGPHLEERGRGAWAGLGERRERGLEKKKKKWVHPK